MREKAKLKETCVIRSLFQWVTYQIKKVATDETLQHSGSGHAHTGDRHSWNSFWLEWHKLEASCIQACLIGTGLAE